ncbi:ABC transporter permease [Thalassospira sp.]|uniref:ABC transporter permease n=1 Tax=Thalassospira sp. TaxID=1912094 RepID=UPI002736E63F|nr:FtsX-like permease family protein [Thalassospira sp.]MDP2699500.1 FtsX-like permease family protein [Thalassospira sp.]
MLQDFAFRLAESARSVLPAWRDIRRSPRGNGRHGIWFLILALTFAVACLASIGSVTSSIREATRLSAQQTIGGDLSLRLFHRPPSTTERDFLQQYGTYSETAEMRVMVAPAQGGAAVLSELKAIDAAYPLYGDLALLPDGRPMDVLAPVDGMSGAIVDADFLDQTGLAIGDVVRIGSADFTLRAVLDREPERAFRLFRLGPRILISQNNLVPAGLAHPGTQTYWYARLKLAQPDQAPDIIHAIETRFPDAGWRIVNAGDGIPGIERLTGLANDFVSLTGLAVFVICAIGIGGAVRAHLAGRQTTIAILRSLGASQRQILTLLLLQILGAAGVATLAGLIVALAVQAPLTGLFFPKQAFTLHPAPLLQAVGFAFLFALIFAILPVTRACQTRPALLFRHQTLPVLPRRVMIVPLAVTFLLVMLALLLLLSMTGSPLFAAIFAVILALCLGFFRLAGMALQVICRLMSERVRHPVARLALRNIARPGSAAPAIVMALGMTASLMIALVGLGHQASHHLRNILPAQSPDLVFFDLPPDQAGQFEQDARRLPDVTQIRQMPFLHGRITHIKGIAVANWPVPRDIAWVIRGDRGLSWSATPPDDRPLIAGAWWDDQPATGQVAALDANIAAGLGIGIGDQMTLNILGHPTIVTIAALRRIDWTRLDLDFPIILSPPRTIPPHGVVSAITTNPDAQTRIAAYLQDHYPAVPMIAIKPVLAQLTGLFDQIAHLLTGLVTLTILAALFVTGGALAALTQHRLHDTAMLRVLGVRPGQIIATGSLELLITGLTATLLAGGIGMVLAQIAITSLTDGAPLMVPVIPVAGLVTGIGILAALTGMALQSRALHRQPGWRG